VEPIISSLHGFRSDPFGLDRKGNTCPFPALKAGLSPSCSPRCLPRKAGEAGLPRSASGGLHTYNLRPACGRQVRNNGFHSELRKLVAHPEGCGFVLRANSGVWVTALGEETVKNCHLFDPVRWRPALWDKEAYPTGQAYLTGEFGSLGLEP